MIDSNSMTEDAAVRTTTSFPGAASAILFIRRSALVSATVALGSALLGVVCVLAAAGIAGDLVSPRDGRTERVRLRSD